MKERISAKVRRKLAMLASTGALWSFDKLSYRLDLRSARNLTLPHFLCIGAQKAGTNWVWENLRCHPELYLPDIKELHYFDLRFYTSLASYSEQFVDGKDRLLGEVTPAYSILPPRKIKFIRTIMPSVKLIFVLRNPVDRAWSRAKMVLREPGASFIDIGKIPERAVQRAISHPSSVARGDYLTIIDNWLRYFSPQQLHICFYDDICQRPKEFLEGIFGFLGVRCNVDWDEFPYRQVVTPGARASIPDKYRSLLESLYRSRIEALYERFGSRVEGWRCP